MKAIVCVLICWVGKTLWAQKSEAYIELGGMGGFASLNYERPLFKVPQWRVRLGIGATLFDYTADVPSATVPGCALCGIEIGAPDNVALTIPVSMLHLVGMGDGNYVELGGGGSWQRSGGAKYPIYASIGFRRHFGSNANWLWKAALTPLVAVGGRDAVKDRAPVLWGGFSIGRRF